MFPTAGLDGWRPLDESDGAVPVARALPVAHEGRYWDPDVAPVAVPYPQAAQPVVVGLTVGDFEIDSVAGRNGDLEPILLTTLRQNTTFGFALLDSLLPPALQSIAPDEAGAGGPGGSNVPCTMAFVVRRAQEDSGVNLRAVTTASAFSEHILRYRQRLLARLVSAWMDAEDEGTVELDVPAGLGWGYAWGMDWGEGGGALVDLPALEAIWEIEARRISDGVWVPVHPVGHWDNEALGDPALVIHQNELRLIRAETVWIGVYDKIRIRGVAVPSLTVDYQDEELPPNPLLGPVFCYCLCLEGARFLAFRGDDMERVASLTADLGEAQRDLMRQAAAHRQLMTTR